MIGLRSRDEPFGFGYQHTGFIGSHLRKRLRLQNTLVNQLAYLGSHTVITQPAGMQWRGYEGMPEAVHGQQWCHLGRIAMVIRKRRFGHGRTGFRLNRMNGNIFAVEFVRHKRKRQAGKITATAGTSNDDIRVFADFFHLFFGFESNNGLMHQYMVENTAQRITGFTGFICHCRLDGFTNRNTKTSGGIRKFFKNHTAGLCLGAGAGDTVGTPGGHHGLAIGLLVEADSDHVNFTFQPILGAGKGKRTAPLPGAGFGGQLLDAEFLVVIGLRNSRIGLVASRRADTFIFIINPGRCI